MLRRNLGLAFFAAAMLSIFVFAYAINLTRW